ncbi:unnamed protein product, partial [Urochloa humidicola]
WPSACHPRRPWCPQIDHGAAHLHLHGRHFILHRGCLSPHDAAQCARRRRAQEGEELEAGREGATASLVTSGRSLILHRKKERRLQLDLRPIHWKRRLVGPCRERQRAEQLGPVRPTERLPPRARASVLLISVAPALISPACAVTSLGIGGKGTRERKEAVL